MLPEYVPMRVAESILFAGKAVRVLRIPSPAFQAGHAVYHQLPKSFQKVQGLPGRYPFQKEPLINVGLGGEDLLPQPEADKIEAMLLDLKVFVHCLFTVSYIYHHFLLFCYRWFRMWVTFPFYLYSSLVIGNLYL